VIAQLDTALQTYLLAQFWERFNACVPLVYKPAFLASLSLVEDSNDEDYCEYYADSDLDLDSDSEHGSDHDHDHDQGSSVLRHHRHHSSRRRYAGPFCSPELHLAVLAMGLRRADHTRPDLARLLLPGWDSTLHRQLRDGLGLGAPSRGPWTVAQVQAVVILAQLERERGRDHSARLYLGMYLYCICICVRIFASVWSVQEFQTVNVAVTVCVIHIFIRYFSPVTCTLK
jgi:hypothetical protein